MVPMCQLCGSVRGRFRKGTMISACLSVWEKAVSKLLPCQTLQFLPICLSMWKYLSNYYLGARAHREWDRVSLCVSSLRKTALDSNSLFHPLDVTWFLRPEFMAIYCSGTGSLGCGEGTLRSWNTPPEFLSTTYGCWASPFHISYPATSLDGCGFFNAVVVRLPFNSISYNFEWWMFYSLVIILKWLCEEVSPVCLRHHLQLHSFNQWHMTEW